MKKSFSLILIMTLLLPPAARAGECPEGSFVFKKVAREDGSFQFQCKCLPGRVALGGRCKVCGPEEQENIRQQYVAALEGMRHSLDALGFEKWRIRYQYGDQAQQMLPHTLLASAIAVAQSPDPVKIPTAGVLLLTEVSYFLTKVRADTNADPDARAAAANVETFKQTLEKKAEALVTCSQPLSIKERG